MDYIVPAAFGGLSFLLAVALYMLLGPPETLAQLWFSSSLLTLWLVGCILLAAAIYRILTER